MFSFGKYKTAKKREFRDTPMTSSWKEIRKFFQTLRIKVTLRVQMKVEPGTDYVHDDWHAHNQVRVH